MLEVIVNVIDFNMNVQDAVNWPRFHHQHLPDELRVEPGYSPDTVAILEKNGYTVRRVECAGRSGGHRVRRTDGSKARPIRARKGRRPAADLSNESCSSPLTSSSITG